MTADNPSIAASRAAIGAVKKFRASPSPPGSPGRGRREAPGEGCKSLRNVEFETLTLPSPRGRGWKRPQFQFVHSSAARRSRNQIFTAETQHALFITQSTIPKLSASQR